MPMKYLTTSVPSGLICMAVSPDGKYFATVGTESSSVLIFDGVTLTSNAKIFTTVKLVQDIHFSPDSCEIFIVNVDSDVEVYDIETQKILKHIPPIPNADYGAFNIDLIHNKLVLTGGSDALVRIWEYVAQDEALLPSQSFAGHVGPIKKIVTAKSEYVISLGQEEGIYTWKLLASGGLYDDDEGSDEEVIDEAKFYSTQEAQKLPFSHYKSLNMKDRVIPLNCGKSTTLLGCNTFGKQNMAWIPKEGVVCYSIENVVVVEDVTTQKKSYLVKHDQAVSALCANEEGTLLASGAGYPSKSSKRATIWLWDVKDKEPICTYEGPRTGIQKLSFSCCSKYLAAISIYPLTKFFVYNTRSGLLIKKGTCSFMINDLSWRANPTHATFLAAGKQNVREFSVKDDKVLRISDFKQEDLLLAGITAVLYTSPEGDAFIFGDTNGKIWIKNANEESALVHQLGSEICTMTAEDEDILVGSRKGHLCRLTYVEEKKWEGKKDKKWQVTGKAMLQEPVLDISFAGGLSQGMVRLGMSGLSHVGLSTGELTPLIDAHKSPIRFVLPSEDNKVLVTVDEAGAVSLWHTEEKKPFQKVMEFEGQSPVLGCALTKQGEILVTTTASSGVNVHNFGRQQGGCREPGTHPGPPHLLPPVPGGDAGAHSHRHLRGLLAGHRQEGGDSGGWREPGGALARGLGLQGQPGHPLHGQLQLDRGLRPFLGHGGDLHEETPRVPHREHHERPRGERPRGFHGAQAQLCALGEHRHQRVPGCRLCKLPSAFDREVWLASQPVSRLEGQEHSALRDEGVHLHAGDGSRRDRERGHHEAEAAHRPRGGGPRRGKENGAQGADHLWV